MSRSVGDWRSQIAAPWARAPHEVSTRGWRWDNLEAYLAMRYSFSAEFLKVTPPDTTFGDAWESLCYALLSEEHGNRGLLRLRAPDGGIDILQRATRTAFQCKSDERGALGSMSPDESIKSLRAAVGSKAGMAWDCYTYATNAHYTGSAVKGILAEAKSLGLASENVEFLGPEHWDGLCQKYTSAIADRFDFRITVTEAQVIEAFQKARYYDEYVKRFAESISQKPILLKVKNNWTPVELDIPFAPDLTVENCLDAVQALLGVSLEWTNFADLGTSTGPSISLTIDGKRQSFNQTIGEVQSAKQGEHLVLWITLVWKDESSKDGTSGEESSARLFLGYQQVPRETVSVSQRRELTLRRAEEMIQRMIWNSAQQLAHPPSETGVA